MSKLWDSSSTAYLFQYLFSICCHLDILFEALLQGIRVEDGQVQSNFECHGYQRLGGGTELEEFLSLPYQCIRADVTTIWRPWTFSVLTGSFPNLYDTGVSTTLDTSTRHWTLLLDSGHCYSTLDTSTR